MKFIIFKLIIPGLFILICLFNGLNDSKKFFTMNLFETLTLVFIYLFSFLYVEKNNKDSYTRNEVIRILKEISLELENYTKGSSHLTILSTQRTIRNKLSALKKIKLDSTSKEDLEYINKEFESLKEFYGEHYTDPEYMQKSKNTITRNITNINGKIDDLIINMNCNLK